MLFAASVLAARPENAGRTIVAIVADSGERYLSQADGLPAAQRATGSCALAPAAPSRNSRSGAASIGRSWTARDLPLGYRWQTAIAGADRGSGRPGGG